MKNKITSNNYNFLCLIVLFFVNNTIAQCWSKISCGSEFTIAIKVDGTLWAWGNNEYGQLGDGTTTNKAIPIQIGTDTNWASVSAGEQHSFAIKTNGTLWAWGRNQYYQIGNGYPTNNSNLVPFQIGTETNWTQVSAGASHTMAIKLIGSTRTLWACGSNLNGKLGFETTAGNYIVQNFTQVGNFTNWTYVDCGKDHTIALRAFSQTGRTLWSWGRNNTGQLGNGTNTDTNIPTQVGTANNWSSCRAGLNHNLARKTNGTLWSWGDNFYGQLGISNTIDQNNPVQIGIETNWEETNYACGNTNSLAKKTDGKLFSWGNNSLGQLGHGNNISYNYPRQVTVGNTWGGLVSAGLGHFSVYRNDGFLFLGGYGTSGQLGNGYFDTINSPAGIACPITLSSDTFSKELSISIYPNPASNLIYINNASELTISSIQIFDMMGQLVYKSSIVQNTLDIQFLSKGTYTIQLNTKEKKQIYKLIKN